jgi:hypothetical protein
MSWSPDLLASSPNQRIAEIPKGSLPSASNALNAKCVVSRSKDTFPGFPSAQSCGNLRMRVEQVGFPAIGSRKSGLDGCQLLRRL